MCSNPITIYNNSEKVHGNNYLVCYQVPCGHCLECLEARATHYKLRSYYETLNCRDNHGICLFDTLTYRDECLPKYKGLPCFSHSDIIKFRKRLRTNIERAGYVMLDENGEEYLRSFIVSEYGSTTKRPHYHIIVWCRAFKEIQGQRLPITAWALHCLIRRSWGYGFTDKVVKQINVNGKGLGAIHYVTKYMSKDMHEVEDLAHDLQIACNNSKTPQEIEEILAEAKDRFKLRVWVSNGLGSYAIVKYLTDKNTREFFHQTGGCFPMPNAKGKISAIPCGHYYTYKLFFDRMFNPNTGRKDRFVINDLGLEFKDNCLDMRIDRLTQSLSDGVCKLTPSECQTLNSLGCDFLKLRSYAVYALVYRNRLYEVDDEYYDEDFTDYHKVFIDGISPYLKDTLNPMTPNYDRPDGVTRQDSIDHVCDHAEKWSVTRNCEEMQLLETIYAILSEGMKRKQAEDLEEKTRKRDLYQRYRNAKCKSEIII